jgi:hypothetical protein
VPRLKLGVEDKVRHRGAFSHVITDVDLGAKGSLEKSVLVLRVQSLLDMSLKMPRGVSQRRGKPYLAIVLEASQRPWDKPSETWFSR